MPKVQRKSKTNKRGRPAADLPDRQWAENEQASLERLADWYDKHDRPGHAKEVRDRLALFTAALPKRFRAGKPAQIYLELREVGALHGPLGAEGDRSLRDAVDAVRALLIARRLDEAKADLPRLQRKAAGACGIARSNMLGRSTSDDERRFASALAAVDRLAEWPKGLRKGPKGTAMLIVARAVGVAIDTMKNVAHPRE